MGSTGRQVRLTSDTERLVAVEQERAGGSFSAATNRLLRTLLTVPEALPHPAATNGAATVTRPPGRAQEARREPTEPAAATKPARSGSGRCSHPILRRIGTQCSACGATVR